MSICRATFAIAALSSALLAGCGGGGGSEQQQTPPSQPSPGPAPTPVSSTPTTPSTLTATAVSTTQINLSWAASTDSVGVTEYRIDRCAGASCTNFAQIAISAATSYNNMGLASSTTYQYRVLAANAAGSLSAYSPTAAARTLAVDAQAPSAPSALLSTAASSTQIDLTWTGSTDNVGVTGYQLERCQVAGCTSFTQIAALTPGNTYSNAGLTSSTSYSYRIRAVDAANNLSVYSNTSNATTLPAPTTPPPSTPVVRSAGCGSAPASLAVGYVQLTVDGAQRQYYFVPPSNYDRNRAYKLVFGFHGNGGRGEFVRTDLAMEATAADQAFYIYPDGQNVPGNGFGWDTFNSESQDVHLVDKIVANLQAGWCINSNAIYANGFSWGGWMSNHMACARPNMFRGIVSIAGGGPDQCTLSKPVAAMIIHGSADGSENISSGIAARNKFISNNRCGATTSATSFKLCVSYNNCAAGQPVLWCEHHPADFQETGPGAGQHIVPDFIKRDGLWTFFNSLQ